MSDCGIWVFVYLFMVCWMMLSVAETVKHWMRGWLLLSEVERMWRKVGDWATVLAFAKEMRKTIFFFFTYILCILIIIKDFSPTDAKLNSLKNNFKFALKLTLKSSYMFWCKTPSSGSTLLCSLMMVFYTETCRSFLISILMQI